MIDFIRNGLLQAINEKSVLILGFGREGRSTYKWLRIFFPDMDLAIADANTSIQEDELLTNDKHLKFVLGKNYLDAIHQYALIIKSPGISLKSMHCDASKISSQTDLFFSLFKKQIVGVTGTKGKSTTVSILYHFIKLQHPDTLLVGNIGIPSFDIFDKISSNSIIVFELSSHQLEYVKHSPSFSILLNLFEEHLDHYNSYLDYQKSKFNIAFFQDKDDFFITNASDERIKYLIDNHPIASKIQYFDYQNANASFDEMGFILNEKKYPIDFGSIALKGQHNFLNVCAALIIIQKLGLEIEKALYDLKSFKPLEHRMEFVLKSEEKSFYNDSIATIPEACIQAVESLPNVQTLILGGFDRGIFYGKLVQYLISNPIKNIILLGKVGDILQQLLAEEKYSGRIIKAENMEMAVDIAYDLTSPGESCLLSPAASSYDVFKNFEERGKIFKELVRKKAESVY